MSRGDSAPSRSGNCLYALYVSSCLPAGPDPLCSSSTLWDLLWVQHPHLAHCAAQHSLLAICSSFTRHEPCQWDGRAVENSRATQHVWFEPSVLLREHLSYSNCVGKLTRPLYSCRQALNSHSFTPLLEETGVRIHRASRWELSSEIRITKPQHHGELILAQESRAAPPARPTHRARTRPGAKLTLYEQLLCLNSGSSSSPGAGPR